jgi:LEA14-like dessication related protein
MLASGRIIALVAILVVVIVIAGFVIYYYDAYHKLTFELKNVGLGTVSITSVQVNFDLAIGNPNALPVYVPDGSFQIYVNNQSLGTGNFGAVTIAGNSQQIITVPMTFYASDVPSVLYGLITGGGNVAVTIQGQANVLLFSVPFNTTLYNASFK